MYNWVFVSGGMGVIMLLLFIFFFTTDSKFLLKHPTVKGTLLINWGLFLCALLWFVAAGALYLSIQAQLHAG